MKYVRVWDLPLRLFHWLLAAAVIAAMLTGQVGGNLMVWHGRLGILIAGLLGFRLAWGIVGSTHSRFASFVRGPAAIIAYLRGHWHGLGHNPLGALSVLGLLTVLGLQAGGRQRGHLGMRAAGLLGKTLAKHGAVAAGDHAAHARIRVGKTKRLGCEPKRLLDEGCGACHDAAMVARRTMRLCKPRRPVNSCRVRK